MNSPSASLAAMQFDGCSSVGFVMLGCAAVVGAGFAVHAATSPRSQRFMPVIFMGGSIHADVSQRQSPPTATQARVALTFDDGPHPDATPRVLAHLRQANAKATFFVIGQFALRYPQLIEQIHREGHLIGNHTFDHSYTGLFNSHFYWLDQLQRTDDAVAAVIGQRPALFRPPMGFRHHRVASAVRLTHHRTVTWTRRAFDGRRTTAQAIVRRLLKPTQANDILLLHDGVPPGSSRDVGATLEALPRVLEGLGQRSFTFVRVDEIADVPGYQAGTVEQPTAAL